MAVLSTARDLLARVLVCPPADLAEFDARALGDELGDAYNRINQLERRVAWEQERQEELESGSERLRERVARLEQDNARLEASHCTREELLRERETVAALQERLARAEGRLYGPPHDARGSGDACPSEGRHGNL